MNLIFLPLQRKQRVAIISIYISFLILDHFMIFMVNVQITQQYVITVLLMIPRFGVS